jgi:hypothetical protein
MILRDKKVVGVFVPFSLPLQQWYWETEKKEDLFIGCKS